MTTLKITRGSTFADSLQLATEECALINATMRSTAPALFEAIDHDIPDEWLVKVEGHPRVSSDTEYVVKRVDADSFTIPCLNAAAFGADRAVVIRMYAPMDLAGYTARMHIRDKDDALLLDLTTENDRIEIDTTLCQVKRTIAADDTEVIEWKKGFFDLELVSGDFVTKVDEGTVEVSTEVTV